MSFQNLMLRINTDKLLAEIYQQIDKYDSIGENMLQFTISGNDWDALSLNVFNALKKNKNLSYVQLDKSDSCADLNVYWENE